MNDVPGKLGGTGNGTAATYRGSHRADARVAASGQPESVWQPNLFDRVLEYCFSSTDAVMVSTFFIPMGIFLVWLLVGLWLGWWPTVK